MDRFIAGYTGHIVDTSFDFKIQYGQIYSIPVLETVGSLTAFKIQYGQIYRQYMNQPIKYQKILKSNMDRFIVTGGYNLHLL